jgi:hypothetical protein
MAAEGEAGLRWIKARWVGLLRQSYEVAEIAAQRHPIQARPQQMSVQWRNEFSGAK